MRGQPIIGIILHARDMFEKDRLVDVLTEEQGKVRVLVKYANRKKNPSRSKLEPIYKVRLIVSQGKSFMWADQVDLVAGYAGIREDFNRISLACYMLNVVRNATALYQANARLYRQLDHSLKLLDQGEPKETVQTLFQQGFAHLEGLSVDDQAPLSFGEFRRLFEEYSGKELQAPVFI